VSIYRWIRGLRTTYTNFDFLERHCPKLVNGIESKIIPKTNNAVKSFIRRFDKHYQSFCGFEIIQTAPAFVAIFEKVYCLTSFSDDAQPAILGKCLLELAGYDIRQLPIATLWNGLGVEWPIKVPHNDVPNP
jgi:hypothetical protein